MRRLTIFVMSIVFLVSYLSPVTLVNAKETKTEITVYCAPNGDDNAEGTIESPLKTLDGARKRVAKLKSQNKNVPITVYFRGGEYHVKGTTAFTEEDSGTETAPVTYAAYEEEKPIFTGATKIPTDKFKPLSDKDAQRVPEAARPYVGVADLKDLGIINLTEFVGFDGTEYVDKVENTTIILLYNGKEQNLAQWPNGINNFSLITGFDSNSDITVDSDGRIKNWVTAENPMIYGWMKYGYSFSRVAVKAVYPESDRIVTDYDVPRGVKVGGEWQIVNLLEELDVPGEYYVDPIALKAYYYPPYIDDDANIEIISNETNIVNMRKTSFITFKGLSFQNNRADAFEMKDSDHISFLGCEFRNIELMAIDTMFCTETTVDGCDFINIGSTGVRFDERNDGNPALSIDVSSVRLDLTPDNNVINNCYFWDVATQSVMYTGAIRIHGVGNKVTNCAIHEGRSSFIHHGGNDIKITNNEIWNGLKTSRDMGMVYNGRNVTQRGNEMAYNYFHDWKTTNQHAGNAMGIYDDDNLSGNYKHHNVFSNGETAVRNSGAPESRFDYNISAKNEVGGSFGAQGLEPGQWLTSMRNFVHQQVSQVYTLKEYEKYTNIKNLIFMDIWPEIGVTIDGNLFYNNGKDISQSSLLMEYVDMSSNILANDENMKQYFNDPENGDYTIRTDIEVPEELKELQKIQLKDIGIYKSEYRRNDTYKLGEFKAYYPYNYEDGYDSKNAYFGWEKSDNADEYILEIASDPAFENIIRTEICPFNFAYINDLDSSKTVYYWRVSAVSNALKNRETRLCTNDVMVFRTNMYDKIDTSLLAIQIEKTEKQIAGMTEGTEPGQVARGTVEKLNSLVEEAKKYLKMTIGEQNKVDQMTIQLQNEVEKAYRDTKIYIDNLETIFSDASGWIDGETAKVSKQNGVVEVKSTSSSVSAAAAYIGAPMSFGSIKSFKIKPTVPKLAAGGTWQAIAFTEKEHAGQRIWSISGAQSLLIVIKYNTVELQIRDGINSAVVLSADSPLIMDEYNDIQLGIQDYGLCQRFILNINGQNVYDYLSFDNLLTKELYFGIYDAPKVDAAGTTGISATMSKVPVDSDNKTE